MKTNKDISFNQPKQLQFIFFSIIFFFTYWLLAYQSSRTQSWVLIASFAVLFLSYGLVISQEYDKIWLKRWLWMAIAFRFLLLFSFPVLSDDYFRFIWDGRLLAAGRNPYLYLPADILHSSFATQAHLEKALFDGLNSPHYFTVYPPLNQLMFGVSTWLSGSNIMPNIVLLRLWIILAEIGTIWLIFTQSSFITKTIYSKKAVLIYALNPLVIVELTGNLHFEAVTIFFVLFAIWALNRFPQGQKGVFLSAGALALGVAVKLLPLIFLPLFIKRLGWRKGLVYCSVAGTVLLILFFPFLSKALIINFGKSLDLYFQKFEFNASFYYALREVGFGLTGYNVIQTLGPLLSIITLFLTIWIANRRGSLIEKMLLTLTIYFLFATTVHPWYISTLIVLGALSGRWYAVLWSALLPLTYLAYAAKPYHENLSVVVVEYILVLGLLIYELFYKKPLAFA